MTKSIHFNTFIAIGFTFLFSQLLSPVVSAQSYIPMTVKTKDVRCNGGPTGRAYVEFQGGHPPFEITWSDGRNKDSRLAEGLRSGGYSVTVKDKTGCTAFESFYIGEPTRSLRIKITAQAVESVPCDNFGKLKLIAEASGGIKPYKYIDSKEKIVSRGGPYQIAVKDSNNCYARDVIHLEAPDFACQVSLDPNDITGPKGYEKEQWIARKDNVNYTIRFENDPDFATAPAQLIEIRHPVDANAESYTLKLGFFGFNNKDFTTGEGQNTFFERLDLREELGYYVDATALYNATEEEMFWKFQTIDPATNLEPADPLIGLLPVNDTLTGSGEGFVKFSVKPKSSTMTGDTLFADASIVFDQNAPVETNVWFNKIDAFPPTSTLESLPDTIEQDSVILHMSGMDDIGGCGLYTYELAASIDSGVIETIFNGVVDTMVTISVERGRHYQLFLLASDFVGNKEMKSLADESFYVKDEKLLEITQPLLVDICEGDSLELDLLSYSLDSFDVFASIDNGPFVLVEEKLDTSNFPYFWPSLGNGGQTVQFAVTNREDFDYSDTSVVVRVNPAPSLNIAENIEICAASSTSISLDNVESAVWSPSLGLSDTNSVSIIAFPEQNSKYYVNARSSEGCLTLDSVNIIVNPVYVDTIQATICVIDSIFLAGAWQTAAGTYTDIFSSAKSCDSTVVTEVTIVDPCVWQSGPIVYVNESALGKNDGTSWIDACGNLQDGLQRLAKYTDAKEIWIAGGTYFPSSNDREVSFVLVDSSKVYGGFSGSENLFAERSSDPSLVELSGDIGVLGDTTDNSYHVVEIDANCTSCVLDGLTIRDGNADFANLNSDKGAGIIAYGTAQVQNIVIESNTAILMGAALFASGASSNTSFVNIMIKDNEGPPQQDVMVINGANLKFLGNSTIQQ